MIGDGSNLFGPVEPADAYTVIGPGREEETLDILEKIAVKIGRTRRPGAVSDIPAGATYLAQIAVHDMGFLTGARRMSRGDAQLQTAFDLHVIYGDGPRHDAACYEKPADGAAPRVKLRLGRARTSNTSPAWGARRDLPRMSCPHLDAQGGSTPTEVLIPSALSDSNSALAQVQTILSLLHNAVVARLEESMPKLEGADLFDMARRVTIKIYHRMLRRDVLGTWLHPDFAARYAVAGGARLDRDRAGRVPAEYMTGVARLGHGLVKDIYSLNRHHPHMGLRDMILHTSLKRPAQMPLTEDWLFDFSHFFSINGSEPQMARALGPHMPRLFGRNTNAVKGMEGRDGGLILRDLVAGADDAQRSVPSLIAKAEDAERGVLETRFAGDAARWQAAVGDWLASIDMLDADRQTLTASPPLYLFLMLEAEADAEGRTLGALGSIIMGETYAAALEEAEAAWLHEDLDAACAGCFGTNLPADTAETVVFLQNHYRFGPDARLH
ncbi:MAG: peroxidase family protein [Pseudomonadota bacterium]